MAVFYSPLKILFLYVSLFSIITIDAQNSFGLHQILRNGDTLISPNQRFELGFFNVSCTRDRSGSLWYLGIWYKGIQPLTVVWVANRSDPLRGNGVQLRMSSFGDVSIGDDEGNKVWIVRLNQPVYRPLMLLLDSGNLVIKGGNINESSNISYIWESFNIPGNTLLPGMKLSWDRKSNTNGVMTSWRSSNDPWYGDYAFRLQSPMSPQLLLENNGVTQSRWGPWTGNGFSGIRKNPVFRVVYHYSDDEVYFMFEMLDDSVLLRLVVSSIGALQFLKWDDNSNDWVAMVTLNKDTCDRYGACGPYGICNADDPGCHCLEGFLANSPHDWPRFDSSGGCRRKYPLNCSGDDAFVKYKGLKLPDNFTVMRGLNIDQCGDFCFRNCTCMAYTNINLYGHHLQCVVWLDKLVDIRASGHDGDELYIRMARAELDSVSHTKNIKDIIITSSIVVVGFLGALIFCSTAKFRSQLSINTNNQDEMQNRKSIPVGGDDQCVRLIEMGVLSAATNGFSRENKIGQGGFGPVYQGQLQNGQKIAVKRLSENSKQGLQEFKNEVNLIAQLQHRCLVKLLGYCVQGEERMLIYEYMPNKSLDHFIFDPARKSHLCWKKRFSILKGIAKGLDYLHFGSRFTVVHRDLKASNVLLDHEMNPKISDFGLARNCENDKEAITKRVVGTYGYMSPEYLIDGHYSTKSDVFSYGVVALEVVSGQRNWGFHHPDHDFNLLGHAWTLRNEGKDLEMIDAVLEDSIVESEVRRCIQIGLLCVQQNSEARPTMSEVIYMLERDNLRLSEPQEPGFYTRRSTAGLYSSLGFSLSLGWMQDDSVNGLTVTELTARP